MPPGALNRRAWAWWLRRVVASALAGALAAVAAPWVVVRELAGTLRAFRRPISGRGRYEGLMPRERYEQLIADDLEWLRHQPLSPSRNHIEVVLRESPYLHYGRSARVWKSDPLEVLGSTAAVEPLVRRATKRRRP